MSQSKPLPQVDKTTQPYWDGAREERLMLPRCGKTGRYFMYPTPWSPFDYSAKVTWEQASGRGVIKSFTVVHQAPYEAYKADVPYVVAVIRLEEGVQLMANVLDCDVAQVAVGAAVQVVFEERAEGFKVPQFQLVAQA